MSRSRASAPTSHPTGLYRSSRAFSPGVWPEPAVFMIATGSSGIARRSAAQSNGACAGRGGDLDAVRGVALGMVLGAACWLLIAGTVIWIAM